MVCKECDRNLRVESLTTETCPHCGGDLSPGMFDSRGSAAEELAEERASANSEMEEDVYRTLLHLLACNLLTRNDVQRFIHFHIVTENLQYSLNKSIEYTDQTEVEEDILVCSNCKRKIKSCAKWFEGDQWMSVSPERSVR